MTDRERVKLLSGPYTPPKLKRGDRAMCLFRDCTVVITSMSAGRIPWPRCRALDQRGGGGSGLLVEEELARAVRSESAAAIKHWWGVSTKAVWHWRRALGVGRADNPGSRRLIRAAAEAGASTLRGKPRPPEQVERRRQTARELDLGRHLRPDHGRGWAKAELGLLGTAPDAEVARRIGRSYEAVRQKRCQLGIANPFDGRKAAP
jgi:hypothetical protein